MWVTMSLVIRSVSNPAARTPASSVSMVVAGPLCPVLPGFRWKRGWDRIFGVGRSTPCSLANRPGNGLVKVKPATAGVDHRLRARGNPAPLRKGAPDAVAAPGGTRYGLGGKGGPRVGWR